IEAAKERYRRIGGRSPLLQITLEQAEKLEAELNATQDGNFKVYVGMRHWDPYIKDTLKKIKDDGIEDVIAVIMAPHTTRASTGGYNIAVDEALEELGGGVKLRYVDDWHTNHFFIEALYEKIGEILGVLPVDSEDFVTIFTAHSLPVKMLENDPYVDKLKESIREILKRIPLNSRLAFQSKGGGAMEWIGPDAVDVIKEAKSADKKGVLLVPLGFVSDHVETLYDIDVLMGEACEEVGIDYARAGSLNTSAKFIELLCDVVLAKVNVS
ncbi:MAG: ferrochelatase, partial [Deltaproteobacteria bacterium]|nr:ferrochelatase [Deltaproteobacteria bacterium]